MPYKESSAGGRYKNLGGPVLKDLDRLERLVNPHCIESGKIWGGHGPPGPPGSAGPDSNEVLNTHFDQGAVELWVLKVCLL